MLFNLKSEDISAYAALASVLIASIALIVAYAQVIISKREARLGVAKGVYKDYLALAFANPEFSSASYPLSAPNFHVITNDPVEYERYEFFVSYLLFAAEEILELTRNNTRWRATLCDQLSYHALYLDLPNFPKTHYADALLNLREEAIKAYRG